MTERQVALRFSAPDALAKSIMYALTEDRIDERGVVNSSHFTQMPKMQGPLKIIFHAESGKLNTDFSIYTKRGGRPRLKIGQSAELNFHESDWERIHDGLKHEVAANFVHSRIPVSLLSAWSKNHAAVEWNLQRARVKLPHNVAVALHSFSNYAEFCDRASLWLKMLAGAEEMTDTKFRSKAAIPPGNSFEKLYRDKGVFFSSLYVLLKEVAIRQSGSYFNHSNGIDEEGRRKLVDLVEKHFKVGGEKFVMKYLDRIIGAFNAAEEENRLTELEIGLSDRLPQWEHLSERTRLNSRRGRR